MGGGRGAGGVVGRGERHGVDAERLEARRGAGVTDDVPGVGVDDVHQRGLRAEKDGSTDLMYVVSSRERTPHFSYCSFMIARASRSSSTPSPGPSGTWTAPSAN